MKQTTRTKHLLRKYGITEEEYDLLYRKQKGRCGVCGRHSSEFRQRLAVDHDHKTGHIRGLLCTHCNRYVVGRHRRDLGAGLLLKAYEYLVAEYPGWIVPPKPKKKRKKNVRRTVRRKD